MADYEGPDEYPIQEIPPEKWWSENFFVGFGCFHAGITVFYSIGRWHSDPTLWRENIVIALPDGTLGFHRGYGRNGSATAASGGLSVYEIIEPGRETRMTFDGPMVKSTTDRLIERGAQLGPAARCRMDVRFVGAAPVWNMKGSSVEAQRMAGGIHIDQICTAHGTIEFEGERYPINDAYVIRDHSRGVRDLRLYAGHNWLSGIFPSGRAFYLYCMKAPDGSIGMSNAAICDDGTFHEAEILETEFITSERGWGRPHRLRLGSALGEMVIDFKEPLATIPTGLIAPYDTCAGRPSPDDIGLSFDEPMKLTWNGQEGRGWSERGYCPVRG